MTAGRTSWIIAAVLTGPLLRAQSGYARMERGGEVTYHYEDHPWAMGQIVVEP